MLTFGSSTLIDLLSWIVVLTLGFKALATIILLTVKQEVRDQPGWGSVLWWATKIAPIIAVPCGISIAWLQRQTSLVWVFSALMVFVVIAVPMKVRQRRARMAHRTSATPLGLG